MTTTRAAEGPEDAAILFLGEAPSHEEVRRDQPFVGPAGALFDRCLHAAGIVRARSRILNVFSDMVYKKKDDDGRIYNGDGDLLWSRTAGFTDLGREASAPTLARIATCSANVIVPMGAPALTLCVDSRSITKWRGSIIAGNEAIGARKVIPSFHPSYALRGAYEARYNIIADFKKAKLQSTFPDLRLPQRNLIIDPDFDTCIAFLQRCLASNLVCTDIELLAGQVDCFSLALTPFDAISIPIVDTDFNSRWTVEQEVQIWALYGRILAAPEITKVNQNISFDIAVLLQLNNLVTVGRLEDPMVAHSVMNPGSGEGGTVSAKSLGVICSLYTDEPYYKDDGSLHDSPTVDDFKSRWLYNAKDAAIALESWLKLEPDLDADGYRQTYEMTMNMVPALVYMTVHGMRLNETALLATRVKVRAKIAALVTELQAIMGRPLVTKAGKTAEEKRAQAGALNINSPAQLKQYFYGEKHLKPYLNSIGETSIDDKALARIFRRDGLREAALLQEYRAASKLLGTYLEIGYDNDMRFRCSYNIRGTWTGRLSSAATVFDSGTNQQNLPEEMRVFLESDALGEAHANAA